MKYHWQRRFAVASRIFPVVDNLDDAELALRWMLNEPKDSRLDWELWMRSRRMCADDISARASLRDFPEQQKNCRCNQLAVACRKLSA